MNSKRKGNAGELEALRLLEKLGVPCHRNEQGIYAGFIGGKGNPDISATLGGLNYHVEVKRTERFSLYAAMDQAQRDATPDTIPAVFYRANRRPWVVIMTLDDFLHAVQYHRSGSECLPL